MQKFLLMLIIVLLPWESFALESPGVQNDSVKKVELKDLAVVEDQVSTTQAAVIGKGSNEIYKKMNYTTAALVVATLLTGREGKASEDHKALGATAGAFYGAQTLFVRDTGTGFKWSDGLYWLAFPFLLAAPVLGGKRASDIDHNRTSTGLTKDHKTIAKIGAWSYLASVALWSFNF